MFYSLEKSWVKLEPATTGVIGRGITPVVAGSSLTHGLIVYLWENTWLLYYLFLALLDK